MKLRMMGRLAAVWLAAQCHGEDFPILPKDLTQLPASEFCKVVEGTTSKDGRFAIAVGLTTGKPVAWSDFKEEGGSYSLDPEAPGFANFVVDLKKDRATALVRGKHPGTRATYNHERCTVAWSEKAKHLVAMQSWKWHTAYAGVYALSAEGAVTASLDLLPVAQDQLRRILERDHGLKADAFKAKYAVALSDPAVTEEGRVTLTAWAEVPKTDDPSVSISLRFTVRPNADGKLSVSDLKVETPAEEAR
ncbi:hypothetical protein OKA05_14535 [Luteolibacter arcticus]|uniref:DUF3108 domain-containing protein n=1 Tax=Luteolibacter arcticus TaxID=1581411 RepID=A0ABT3GJY5_9BACT|nr:hypothetical protein [Luteolibacter arcticus]MCW1923781.1 hypothetical protein [Luteolibacter arcticus]